MSPCSHTHDIILIFDAPNMHFLGKWEEAHASCFFFVSVFCLGCYIWEYLSCCFSGPPGAGQGVQQPVSLGDRPTTRGGHAACHVADSIQMLFTIVEPHLLPTPQSEDDKSFRRSPSWRKRFRAREGGAGLGMMAGSMETLPAGFRMPSMSMPPSMMPKKQLQPEGADWPHDPNFWTRVCMLSLLTACCVLSW